MNLINSFLRLRAVILLSIEVFLFSCGSVGTEPLPGEPPHHVQGGFRNTDPSFHRPALWTRWSFLLRRVGSGFAAPRNFDAPHAANDGAALRAGLVSPSLTWIGHATFLIQMDGLNILTDPQWSARASPVSWAGPRRFSPPGVAFEDLPRIDVVVISHDHYDHLDLATVKRLAATHNPLFLVPLGIKDWLAAQGVTRVEELDWWQERGYRGVRFVCLPAQHFSQRTLWDANRRLWASWSLISRDRRFYFGGDSGYFSGFEKIGRQLGPFDITAIAIGAYLPSEMMQLVHMTPERAVQAFVDLNARVLLGMHWGTFDLTEEPPEEPPQRMLAEIRRRGIDADRAWILKMGETRRW